MSTLFRTPSNQPDFVDNVPAEIWTEIFQNVVVVDGKPTAVDTHTEWNTTQLGIMPASQTCIKWRDITLETPCLWSTIVVDFNSSECFFPSSNLSLTNLWLRRSKSTPLSIALFNIPEVYEDTCESHECLVAIFLQMPRWKYALLSWTASSFDFWSSRDYLMSHAPLLESLILKETPHEDIMGRGTLPSEIWLRSPSLRKLVVLLDLHDYLPPEVDYLFWGTSYNIPYRQLTHLCLEAHPKEVIDAEALIYRILLCAPDLISCFVTGIIFHEGSWTRNRKPVFLRHLRHLYMSSSIDVDPRERSLSVLLNNMTAPSLVALSLCADYPWDIRSYKNFILRSSCSLEVLNLIFTPIPISDSLTCLELSPSLKQVSFHSFTLDESFLARWTAWDVSKGRYELCPNLEQLSVAGNARTCLSIPRVPSGPSLIAQSLASRIHLPTGTSKKFSFLIPSFDDEDVSAELRSLCTGPDGLVIAFNDDVLKMSTLWELYADRLNLVG